MLYIYLFNFYIELTSQCRSTNCYANEPESISILRNAPVFNICSLEHNSDLHLLQIISELETPRQKHSCVTIEDTIYVFGGKYTATKLTPVECYSSEASAWAQKGENKPRFVFVTFCPGNRTHFTVVFPEKLNVGDKMSQKNKLGININTFHKAIFYYITL